MCVRIIHTYNNNNNTLHRECETDDVIVKCAHPVSAAVAGFK